MTFTACFRRRWAFRGFIAHLTDCPPSSRPILNLRSSRVSAGVYAFSSVPSASSLGWTIGSCMHCMHQKTDYACYARTQLRKRLHTMHTETRIGVSVGLRGCKCMQLGMHTKRIQNAYKHKKEDSSFYFFFILSVLLSFSLPAIYSQHPRRPRLQACMTPPDSPPRPRKKRPTSKGGAFRVTGRNQAVWRPRVGWRRPKPASVMPMQASAMTASMAPPTSRPVRARLGR